jgi:hypothetical protein
VALFALNAFGLVLEVHGAGRKRERSAEKDDE